MSIPTEHVDELIESMRAVGQLVPLIVMPAYNRMYEGEPVPDQAAAQAWFETGGGFEIIDGHCRWMAARDVPLDELDCSVFTDVAEAKHAMMLHAGIIRQSFTAYEEGRQFVELGNKHGWSIADLCKTFHRSEGYINDRVSIAEAREDICLAVHAREINLGQAKQIIRAKEEGLKTYLLDQAKVHGATARTLEVMRQNWEKDNIFAQTGVMPHTPAYSQVVEPAAVPTCVWCGEADDLANMRTVQAHYYCLKPMMAVVDATGSKNILKGAIPGAS